MFNADNKINRILGNGQGQGIANPRQGLGFGRAVGGNFGRGFGPEAGESFKRNQTNANTNNILFEITRMLDKLPDIKSAKGDLVIKLSNGNITTLKLEYRE